MRGPRGKSIEQTGAGSSQGGRGRGGGGGGGPRGGGRGGRGGRGGGSSRGGATYSSRGGGGGGRGRGGGGGRGRGRGGIRPTSREDFDRQVAQDDAVAESYDEDMQRLMSRMQSFDDEGASDPSDDGEDENVAGSSGSGESEGESDEGSSGASDEDDGESDEEEDEDDEEVEEKATAQQVASIQAQLAEIPFDQLIEIQQKVGMKKFLADIRQGQAPELPDSDLLTRASEKAEGKSRTKLEKRASKNAPIEITSKRSVGRRRDVVELPKNKTRDPRFDPLAGKLNEGLFNQSYGFLRDYQQDEIEDLRKKVVVEKDVDSKTKMERNLKRLESQMLARQKKEKRQEIVRDWRKKEAELVQKGKKPWQLKQSDIKKLELIDRYQHMKKKDLDKLLEKRRKKNASKEKRFLPYARRSAAE